LKIGTREAIDIRLCEDFLESNLKNNCVEEKRDVKKCTILYNPLINIVIAYARSNLVFSEAKGAL